MYQLRSLLAIGPSLLLCLLPLPSAHANILRPNLLQSPPSPPFQVPQYCPHRQDPRTLLTRWRDRVIRTFWSVSTTPCPSKAASDDPASYITPPPSLLSRYGGDVVLRFNISSVGEAEALVDAIGVLILDVWEFTTDWVDIRLSKDIVSLKSPLLGDFLLQPLVRYLRS